MNAVPGSGSPVVIILAAGEGTRMKSSRPKVLHSIAGRSLLQHVVSAAAEIEPAHVMVVVGHGRDEVIAHLDEVAPWVDTVVQQVQAGTGHAVRVALEALIDGSHLDTEAPVIVLSGDTPLLTGRTVAQLLSTHQAAAATATLLSARLADPSGYGRVVRDASGEIIAITEHKDANPATLAIDEINAGMYVFAGRPLMRALANITTANAQGEEYLTDVLALLSAEDERLVAWLVPDSSEILGVNDRVQLAGAAGLMQQRINDQWMRAGVAILDPGSVWIDVDVDLAADVVLMPQTHLVGPTTIATGARIGPGTTLKSCEVGVGASVVHTMGELAVIGDEATVGPFTYLRPGTRLGIGAKAGAFVEMKNAELGTGSKVPHLSYVGDAVIGIGTNIGAATVFVNYDGANKHHTIVGDQVRIGSDTMLIAPISVGDGAYTAAGSVITEDVPAGAMAVGRARQRNISGWVQRRRAGTASAAAAQLATPASAPASKEESQ